MRFRITNLLWITAVIAVALGSFGPWGILAAAGTFYGWVFVLGTRRDKHRDSRPPIDGMLVFFGLGALALLIALYLSLTQLQYSEDKIPSLVWPLFYVVLSLLPALALWRKSNSEKC